ncbi:LysR family transcriptional regulator [Pelomonas sp. KK5]|uniref:LysR family transcriptional regulator n=1 Tax=Pelomonas sp. KK5 TaxID=1855730 RepID=UPI00097C8A92|nr:LysR family transcriptional regulator [Pelomonas sp. KK5]
MDKLSAMRTFARVVEAGSFSAVALEAGSSQSAVSKQVAALERELGATLLTRTTRSLALTDEGARYFEHARRLLAEIEEAEAELRDGGRALSGWLRVSASVAFGRLKLMPLVPAFLKRHPRIRLDLRLHDGFVDLVEQGLDAAVRIGDLPDSGLVARRIGDSQRLLLAHRSYLRRRGVTVPREPADLRRHACIVYTGRAAPWTWSFTRADGAAASVRVEGPLQTNSSEVMRASLLAGMGIGYSPHWLFEQELASGEVRRLLPDWDVPVAPIQLVCPPQRRHAAKVKALGDYLAERLSAPRAVREGSSPKRAL